eukprot:TRINITY_DN7427_c0_g1_i1.p1 TRINITY_DN7427_c0_g1~~TRINITY_DN7427_c0_g1_i1.p1  ORF type:complete len:551 (+),score=87.32 TRINITY_DN7427_c0_g1_i1:150-1802(+)
MAADVTESPPADLPQVGAFTDRPRPRSPRTQTPLGRGRTQSLVQARGGTPPASPSDGGSDAGGGGLRLQRRGTTSSLSSASTTSSQWSARSGEAWSEDSRRRQRLRQLVAGEGQDGQTDTATAVGTLLRLLGSAAPTTQAVATLVQKYTLLAELILLRLLRAIAPDGDPPVAESPLPAKAIKAVRSYGVEGAPTVRAAAEALCQGSKVHKFVRDSCRVCEGLTTTTDGILTEGDLCTFVEVFDLRSALSQIAAEACAPEASGPPKRRLSADPRQELSELHIAAATLIRMAPAHAEGTRRLLPRLCDALRKHQGLAQAMLLRVIVGLAPEGSRCAKLSVATEPLPAAASKMLKAYGVAVRPGVTTAADAAEELMQGNSLERFARDACRVAVGVDASDPLDISTAAQLVSVFRLRRVTETPPCHSACRACWGMIAGTDGPAMRSFEEIERIVETREEAPQAGGATTWAQQTLAKGPRRDPEHLRELHELARRMQWPRQTLRWRPSAPRRWAPTPPGATRTVAAVSPRGVPNPASSGKKTSPVTRLVCVWTWK